MDVKYESMHKPEANIINKLSGYIYRNPTVYFVLVFSVTLGIIIFCPHTKTFRDDYIDVPDDFELSREKILWIVDKNPPVQKQPSYPAINPEKYKYEHNMYPDKEVEEGNEVSPTVHRVSLHLQSKPLATATKPDPYKCKAFQENQRFDCFPQGGVTEDDCNNRGCCWAPVNSTKGQLGVPFCYYPSDFKTYTYSNISITDFGVTAILENKFNSSYPGNVQLLKVDVNFLLGDTLQIKIYDANNPRFESPFPNITVDGQRVSRNSTSYDVNIDKDKLGFKVLRKSNNQSIFNSQDVGGFIFADQMLQISAELPSRTLYGLGQQRNDFLLDMDWRRVTLFNHDQEPTDMTNLYGSHPFYLAMEDNGTSHGVFLHNTNAMDIILQPLPAITYRAIGGVLNFYFFLGPTPSDVIRQYTELIGRPVLPPYWSLGFHLCRYGYQTLEKTKEVWNRTRAAGIPYDTQWNDIDYMVKFNDFTYDKTRFKGLPEFVDQLHKEGMHYMIITDPGVSAGEQAGTYPPYDEGLKEGIFLKDPVEDKPFLTKVWNTKNTVFPDFFHPKTQSYWTRQISRFHDEVPFDGLWIDMNDPSTEWSGGAQGCPATPLDNPPYLPAVQGGKLYSRTVCMSARHYNCTHYDVHNIFASQEALLTFRALREVKKKRPFIISRSSYPGQGQYSGVWTGDITSTWDDMAHSISDVLAFSLFGIPLSGADICGFNGNTTVSLCKRWSQLGAFYPFSRNHNSVEDSDQDPVALGEAVVDAARKALLTRYSLLPYLYTLFWKAHTLGDTVARPMFVQFPKDDKTYSLNSQFMWGAGLVIAPLLSEEKTYPTAYLPKDRWYDFYSYRPIDSNGSTFILPSSSDSIPLLLKGGEIIPTQLPNTTTTVSRKNPFGLLVSLCKHGNASGELYWDDGDSLDFEKGVYNHIMFKATGGNLTSSVEHWTYKTEMMMSHIKILGVTPAVTKVEIDGVPAKFSYKPDVKFLQVTDLTVDLGKEFILSWA